MAYLYRKYLFFAKPDLFTLLLNDLPELKKVWDSTNISKSK